MVMPEKVVSADLVGPLYVVTPSKRSGQERKRKKRKEKDEVRGKKKKRDVELGEDHLVDRKA